VILEGLRRRRAKQVTQLTRIQGRFWNL